MRRAFWISVGVAVGAIVVYQGHKLYKKYTPEAVAERLETQAKDVGQRTQGAVATFTSTFKDARAAREDELINALLAQGQVPAEKGTRARFSPDPGRKADSAPIDPNSIEDIDPVEETLGYSF
ncbi:MAG: hypothetical protein LBH13_01080 [Cellulomonadaceae bacterium]|jgi:hypothetical protein|nr:hypothetical protein [Cellulomonadaceae bacterium]